MPGYAYRAVDAAGRRQRGVIEATSPEQARRALRDRALLPETVFAAASGGSAAGDASASPLAALRARFGKGRVSARALSSATRQLATLIGSDVRVDEALRLVAGQGDGAIAALLLDVRAHVLEGSSLAAALAAHPRSFPEFYRASIRAGEQSGRLPEVLAYLADFVETRQRASRTIRLALLYPALLAGVSAAMMTAMMIYVVPDIVRVFVSRGADLPFLTRALIGLSGFISRFGLITLIALAAAVWFGARALAVPARRLAADRLLATTPPLAHFTRQANAARFSATLATLVQSAVPLLDALSAAAATVPNRHIRAQAVGVATRVREGDSVHRAMAEADAFPKMLVAIVASGETGGKLGPALARAAAELDREVESQVAVLVSLVEPAVLLTMGGLVLLMVLAILLPIIGLNDLAVG